MGKASRLQTSLAGKPKTGSGGQRAQWSSPGFRRANVGLR